MTETKNNGNRKNKQTRSMILLQKVILFSVQGNRWSNVPQSSSMVLAQVNFRKRSERFAVHKSKPETEDNSTPFEKKSSKPPQTLPSSPAVSEEEPKMRKELQVCEDRTDMQQAAA